ncbi:TPA: hypothetical protein ACGCT2_002974 [Vibrio cholerae O1]|uniref:hypothetical protein n=2 Tax=Vibrio cholerae TaxID=666 RepID=UPI0016579BDF|nr:hypothetical protein [Vibrio cholerae]EGR0524999.1 hypothetical protein [Vibrio cholerae]EGR0592956.1 hypothetical protein [Vibrio cholerae]EGR0600867.1 hypothetical protein [Vibrio cholerae]MBC9069467.1 hypothetical protein [Vibrio cholerae]HBC2180821.1 hypothetical protein [Vibrio cholerae]
MNTQALEIIIQQLDSESKKLMLLGSELEKTASWMMAVNGRPEFKTRQNVYLPKLEQWRKQKQLVNSLIAQKSALQQPSTSKFSKSVEQIRMEEKRAIKEATVTSSTYERAQRRLFRQVDKYLCGK